tara:strand:+ start:3060 stop:3824 length:765 start_codon:yes stop_codon:yes gene_type:complete
MDGGGDYQVDENGFSKRVYDLDEVAGLCSTRNPEPGNEYGLRKDYIDKIWNNPNPMVKRKAFVDKDSGDILGFAVYEISGVEEKISGVRLLQYELHLICVKAMVEKSTTPPYIGIFKYMLADVTLDLLSEARRQGATEARIKIMAVKTAYPMWWYMGFRHPANSQHRTYNERAISDDGRPMYLWVMDPSGKDRHNWRLVDKSSAWINGDSNVKERMREQIDYKPSNPKPFFDYVQDNTAESTFPKYRYESDYKI